MTTRIAAIGIFVALVPATASADWSGKGQLGGVLPRTDETDQVLSVNVVYGI